MNGNALRQSNDGQRKPAASEGRKTASSPWARIRSLPWEWGYLVEHKAFSSTPAILFLNTLSFRCFDFQQTDAEGRPGFWMSDDEIEAIAGVGPRERLDMIADMLDDPGGLPILKRGDRRTDGKRFYSFLEENWQHVRSYKARDLARKRRAEAARQRELREADKKEQVVDSKSSDPEKTALQRGFESKKPHYSADLPTPAPTLAEVKARLQPLISKLTSGREKLTDADVLKLRKKLPPARALDVLEELIAKRKPNHTNPHTLGLVLTKMADEAIATAIEREEEEAVNRIARLAAEEAQLKREAAWNQEEAATREQPETRDAQGNRLLAGLTPEELKARQRAFALFVKADSDRAWRHKNTGREEQETSRARWIQERLLEELNDGT